ncbi:MAG: type I restriction endonuclease [Bacteroidales bacterium]|nr:type I restriction endonuclease [Bacteroidales bacterium]
MDFKDAVKQLGERILKLKKQIKTEEATKNAFILPFLQILGYDVFNPLEVVPEMDCDLVKKKGDKIDYAIMKDGSHILLIECKHWEQDLTLHDTQLKRYYVASKAKFGILTNGIIYRFYTDLEKTNIMDDRPFLEVDLTNLKDFQFEELKKFHKSYFDVDTILSSASELKYTSELKSIISTEFNNPSPDFVRLLSKQVYDGQITSKILTQFTGLVKKSIANYINDVIAERLLIAQKSQEASTGEESKKGEDNVEISITTEKVIETTSEEVEGFYLVKSILRNTIDPARIFFRDAVTYFAILVDDNNRKTVCRLYFNSPTNKQIAIIDENKKEIRHKLSSLNDIYDYSDDLIKAASTFVNN